MNVGDEHLVGIQIKVEGDDTDAVFAARWTEIAEFGTAWPFEVQFETPLFVHGTDPFDRSFREIAFQQCEFFRLHHD